LGVKKGKGMKNGKSRDYSTIIIWSAGLVGMLRYAAAFLSSDLGKIEGVLSIAVTWAMGLSGFFMGILGTLGTLYIFDGWRQKMPKTGDPWNNKFIALTVFVFAAFFTEILILVPFTMSRIERVSVADVLQGGVWWWSTAVVIMPILLIGGVSVGNKIVSVREESFRQVSEPKEEPRVKLPANWRQVRKTLTDEQVKSIAIDQTKNIAFHFGIDERTARNWRKYAQEEVKQ
jgi:hypothetical protein